MTAYAIKTILCIALFLGNTAVTMIDGEKYTTLYLLMRTAGAMSVPVACFFLVEGFYHTSSRKKYFVLYVKEGAEIVDLLNIMEAHVSLMELENLRIVKEMRNSINRRVNCEVANITKTVNAASKQIEDITYIKDHHGFDNLQDGLRQMAEVRLENPDATLSELGQLLDPPVGKSGVNHRLRKLSDIADRIRGN